MHIELLSKRHSKRLFHFELENRAWFESFIAPREENFYSKQGVIDHIRTEMDKVDCGTAFCGLLIKGNEIVARANLRDICTNKAMVGYRVAKRFTSQGCASFCLASLVNIGKREFDVKSLEAKVLQNNPASKYVLIKQGFKIIGSVPNFITLDNKSLACTEFRLIYA
jgi:ribosomal-protein-alanine N-acetyltransferase